MNNNKIYEKVKMKIAISKINEENDIVMKNKTNKLNKAIITALTTFAVGTGVVFASTIVYENVWKEPETYEFSSEITEKDKVNAISENEVREKAEKYLKQIGLEEEVSKVLLTKDIFNDNVVWDVGFSTGNMVIDNKGNFHSLNIPSYTYKKPKNYGITREEARKTAMELLEKYNPYNNSNEYELVSLKRNMETDEASYIWYADFYKKYGELYNKYEKISIGWVPTVNGLYSLNIENLEYENNEQKISKEEAINIAIEKDKTIEKRYNIKSAEATIWIDKMNTDVVYREKNVEEYETGHMNFEEGKNGKIEVKKDAVFYKVENRVRKVWEVIIYYDYIKYAENGPVSFTYYIDATTGEIIGGNRYRGEKYYLELLRNDQHNLIEK